MRRPPANSTRPLEIEAGYGRLYVRGVHAYALSSLPGATLNEEKGAYELSLTLETLRSIKRKLGWSSAQLASCCSESVMRWARAAGESEHVVADLHRRLGEGWRLELPWQDHRAGTMAPVGTPQVRADGTRQVDEEGRWTYRAPFEHQQVMGTVGGVLDGAAFICEVGTGKTRAGTESAAHHFRENHFDVLFVICRNRGLSTWKREIPVWSDQFRVHTLEGSVRERGQTIQDHYQERGTVFCLNYEVLARLKKYILAAGKRVRIGIILDEMHKIRNASTAVAKAAMDVARASVWRLGMTGTPVLQGVQDVWSQWYVVDLGIEFGANLVQFRREFLNENPYSFDIEPVEGAPINIGLRMRRRGLRYRKEDCLDLPPRLYETLEVEMTTEQARAYEEMAEILLARLSASPLPGQDEPPPPPSRLYDADDDDPFGVGVSVWMAPEAGDGRIATAANQLAMILRLSQITSGFLPTEDGGVHVFDPNPKMAALEELVRETVRTQQIIVWARYRRDVETIIAMLRDLSPVHIYGGMPRSASDRSEMMFQDGSSRILVANPQAAGDSITLTAASMAVYYSQTYSLEQRLQSEGRNHREGSQIHNAVTYFDLRCRRTVDEIVSDALTRKLSLADVVVDLRSHIEGR